MTIKDPGIVAFDRSHAAKIFVPNNFGMSPKYSWLFHVAFDLNPEVSRRKNDDILKMGLLVKNASLPKFTVDTKTMNAYNRVDIVQTKVKYDQVVIKFHDDNLDIIRNFWYDYYSYYYRDSDWNLNIYQAPTKYVERQQQTWGYTPRQYPTSSPATQQFIDAIRIYSLHNKKFTEYTLINPTIVSFRHGEHAQGGEAGTLEHEMTVQFQAVKYAYGQVTEDTVSGFATLTYDTRPSGMGTTTVTDRNVHDLSDGLTGLPGILNNIKNLNGAAIAGAALSTVGSGLLSGQIGFGAAGTALTGVTAGIKTLGTNIKTGIGKVFSNGQNVDYGNEGRRSALPNDANGTDPTDVQGEIDQLTAQVAADEETLAQTNADLEAGKAEQEQLEAQIESDTYTLEYDPNLTEEDIAALQQIIEDNQAKLEEVKARNEELQSSADALVETILDNRSKIDQLQAAQNPSGNSEEEGGPGEDSTTIYNTETGETIKTNPDGSQTIVLADGSIYTVPQQNPVDNDNASSNQQQAIDW